MLATTVFRCVLVLGLSVLTLGVGNWRRALDANQLAIQPEAVWPTTRGALVSNDWALEARGSVPMPPDTRAAHASHLLAMPPGHPAALTAFWFAGDRESAPNVQIAASQWNRASQQWTPARFVVNRHAMAEQLGYGLRRLGNPVAWLDADGRMHLFVVATGWGGWAASRILHLRQVNVGKEELQFEPVRVLHLSWFWNISYLVRNPPLRLSDGGMVLPVHFELGLKHASALRFDRHGEFTGMVRISGQWDRLQPTLVMQSPTEWLALMRVQRVQGKIAVARTADAGAHWTDLADLTLDNPDSAVAGLGLESGHLALAFNPSAKGRTALELDTSADGSHWTQAAMLAQGLEPAEFSYPAMAWADGKLWVSYTVDRTHIEWQRFSVTRLPVKATP